jgi:tRNA-2-methylthio-N6-dimethylallyladenosine synthase
VQAGDDEVLSRMRRGYTADDYRRLIDRIRERLPGGSIATDIIVGFPGETEEQYIRTYDLMRELKLDVAHLARYSPRPRTVSARRMPDDVPEDEKMRRFQELEDLQESVSSEINASYLEREVEVLVEKKRKGQWMGRTDTNKLVFFEAEESLIGELVRVKVEHAGPWSMRGALVGESEQHDLVPIPVLN